MSETKTRIYFLELDSFLLLQTHVLNFAPRTAMYANVTKISKEAKNSIEIDSVVEKTFPSSLYAYSRGQPYALAAVLSVELLKTM